MSACLSRRDAANLKISAKSKTKKIFFPKKTTCRKKMSWKKTCADTFFFSGRFRQKQRWHIFISLAIYNTTKNDQGNPLNAHHRPDDGISFSNSSRIWLESTSILPIPVYISSAAASGALDGRYRARLKSRVCTTWNWWRLTTEFTQQELRAVHVLKCHESHIMELRPRLYSESD